MLIRQRIFAAIIFRMKMMLDNVKITDFEKIAIAVSGGRDSMALLRLAMERRAKGSFYVVNIEHGIRGEESISDSEFVMRYCEDNGIECRMIKCDVPSYKKENSMTMEQAAREMRRASLMEEVLSGRADRVALAHHKDDNAESILMHIFRGSGIRGLRGMEYDNGVFIRPLLCVTRDEIDAFIEKTGAPYREDSTNSDVRYTRNYVRREIMPSLKKVFPSVVDSIIRLSKNAAECDEYISKNALNSVEFGDGYALIDVGADDAVFKSAAYEAFCHLGVTADVETRHYESLLALRKEMSGVFLDMPHGVEASKEYNRIALAKTTEKCVSEVAFCEGTHLLGEYALKVERVSKDAVDQSLCENGKRALFLDGGGLDSAVIRTRRHGDTFRSFGGHTKKLGDYLTDKKIPSRLRNMPIIAIGSEVAAVAGEEIGARFRITDKTEIIYKLTLTKNI